MSLLDHLEHKFGRYAVPHSLRIVVIFQVIVWIMLKFQPEFCEWLVLDVAKVWQGEVWRLATFIFIPRSMGILWLVMSAWLMLMIADTLEQAWGTFRLTLYLFGGMVAMIAGAFRAAQERHGE